MIPAVLKLLTITPVKDKQIKFRLKELGNQLSFNQAEYNLDLSVDNEVLKIKFRNRNGSPDERVMMEVVRTIFPEAYIDSHRQEIQIPVALPASMLLTI